MGGIIVSLSSGTPSVATVPVSVTVLAGQSTATFTVTPQNVSSVSTSLITASIGGGSSANAIITVDPASGGSTPSLWFLDQNSQFDVVKRHRGL